MYYKPTSAFKLSKTTKRVMATISDPVRRGQYKRIMMEAQLYAEEADKKPFKGDKSKQDD